MMVPLESEMLIVSATVLLIVVVELPELVNVGVSPLFVMLRTRDPPELLYIEELVEPVPPKDRKVFPSKL
jgi:hypothetical protein